ncbi:MAG: DUF3343 domain-containing protein [Clostridia bacterium]|nr:DUF3343 domain-containing protein [Clostridia bacterium]
MDQSYGVAAYRSRQQVMKINDLLRRNGISSSVVSTPREISAGCGLSVRFNINDAANVKRIVSREKNANLIGLYRVDPSLGRGRLSVL